MPSQGSTDLAVTVTRLTTRLTTHNSTRADIWGAVTQRRSTYRVSHQQWERLLDFISSLQQWRHHLQHLYITIHYSSTHGSSTPCRTISAHCPVLHGRKKNAAFSPSPCAVCELQPELTGGMMATSSPAWIACSAPEASSSSSTSTYSRLTVTAQLLSTFSCMPGYASLSLAKRSRTRRGAGSCSVVLPVKVAAAAKYKTVNRPAASFGADMVPTSAGPAKLVRQTSHESRATIRPSKFSDQPKRKCSAGHHRSDSRIIHAILENITRGGTFEKRVVVAYLLVVVCVEEKVRSSRRRRRERWTVDPSTRASGQSRLL